MHGIEMYCSARNRNGSTPNPIQGKIMSQYSEAFERLKSLGKFHHGAVIPRSVLLTEFGVHLPGQEDLEGKTVQEIRRLFKDEELAALNVWGHVQKELSEEGMHFVKSGDSYRVPLLSEMHHYSAKYLRESKQKLAKAESIFRSIPIGEGESTNMSSRIAQQRNLIDKASEKVGIHAA